MNDGRRQQLYVGPVEICAETFGDPSDPSILVIGGTSSPMDAWHEDFCLRLAAGSRHVIRYDNRDTGQSTSYPPGKPGYDFHDMVGDALGLLDALDVESAHLAGGSLGGAVARAIAIEQPERARSLTLLSSTPRAPGDPHDPTLPPPTPEQLLNFFGEQRDEPDWGDRTAYIDNYVLWDRQFAGPRHFDETESREYAGRVYDRTVDIHAASVNHSAADPGRPMRSRLAEIKIPTLVIHGTVDPILPFGHAEALVREIPHARLLALDGVGHQLLPPAVWDTVVSAILRHTNETPSPT